MVRVVSAVQERALYALAEYRWLTVQHMIAIGVGKDVGHLRQQLNRLMTVTKDANGKAQYKPNEIGVVGFGAGALGKMSRYYYLTDKGAALLEGSDYDGPPPRPVKNPPVFRNDYWHKTRTIDFRILLANFIEENGYELQLERQYFNRLPKAGTTPARPETSIDLSPGYIDPDSIYRLRDPDGRQRLLLVEVERGRKTEKAVEKIIKYAQILSEGEEGPINRTFRFGKRAPRVIWLFEDRSLLESVQKRLAGERWLETMGRVFYLKTIGELSPETLLEGWHRPSIAGERVSLF